jgi:hypothetical protein
LWTFVTCYLTSVCDSTESETFFYRKLEIFSCHFVEILKFIAFRSFPLSVIVGNENFLFHLKKCRYNFHWIAAADFLLTFLHNKFSSNLTWHWLRPMIFCQLIFQHSSLNFPVSFLSHQDFSTRNSIQEQWSIVMFQLTQFIASSAFIEMLLQSGKIPDSHNS